MAKNWALEYIFANTNYVSVSHSISLNVGSDSFTWESWIKLYNNTNAYYAIWSKRAATPAIYLLITSAQKIYSFFRDSDGVISWQASGDTINLNQYYHIAQVRDKSINKHRVFLGGIKFIDVDDNTDNLDSTGNLFIGQHNNGQEWDGIIDECRFVKGYALYSENFTPPTRKFQAITGTAGLWHFDNNYLDSSGNGNHGTPSDPPPTFVYPGAPLIYGRPAPLGQNGLAGADMLRGLAL